MSSSVLQVCRWHPVPDVSTLQQMACDTILDCSNQAIRDRGRFNLVLSGGNTPREVYRRLSMARADWASWHIYFGDERCLPIEDPDRNSRMALDAWLQHVPIPARQIHLIPAELEPQLAARLYANTLMEIGYFDLVLLGLGEDGHTASLFPHRDWGTEAESPDALAVLDAPIRPPQRVSLSAARLSRTRHALFLVSGKSKHEAVKAWRDGKDIPAVAIRPPGGVDIIVASIMLTPTSILS